MSQHQTVKPMPLCIIQHPTTGKERKGHTLYKHLKSASLCFCTSSGCRSLRANEKSFERRHSQLHGYLTNFTPFWDGE